MLEVLMQLFSTAFCTIIFSEIGTSNTSTNPKVFAGLSGNTPLGFKLLRFALKIALDHFACCFDNLSPILLPCLTISPISL